jgi:hypothetical protein
VPAGMRNQRKILSDRVETAGTHLIFTFFQKLAGHKVVQFEYEPHFVTHVFYNPGYAIQLEHLQLEVSFELQYLGSNCLYSFPDCFNQFFCFLHAVNDLPNREFEPIKHCDYILLLYPAYMDIEPPSLITQETSLLFEDIMQMCKRRIIQLAFDSSKLTLYPVINSFRFLKIAIRSQIRYPIQ